MDYKVFRTAVLAIVSTLILVLVIVYATNADKIKEIFGKGGASDTEASADTSSSSDFGMYGEQIGDNTQAFLFEEGTDFQDTSFITRSDTSAVEVI